MFEGVNHGGNQKFVAAIFFSDGHTSPRVNVEGIHFQL